ncbi:MAG: hypothetical protein Q4C61_09260 [Lachnospiraceae bacterium]|nr:hypothetical protein [Lachnospiraceae bacterium]
MARIFASKDPKLSLREERNMQRARRIAAEGMVLLKNDGGLPIPKSVGRLALFGNGTRHTVKGGTGSGDVNSRMTVSAEQGEVFCLLTLEELRSCGKRMLSVIMQSAAHPGAVPYKAPREGLESYILIKR